MKRMNENQLATAIESACLLLDEQYITVVGPAALLATYPEASLPEELLLPPLLEVEVTDRLANRAAMLARLGESSSLQRNFGVQVQALPTSELRLPTGWRERLVDYVEPMNGTHGLCLDPHDLCVNLLASLRPNALAFVAALARGGFLQLEVLQSRLQLLRVQDLGPVDATRDAAAYLQVFTGALADHVNIQRRIRGFGWPLVNTR